MGFGSKCRVRVAISSTKATKAGLKREAEKGTHWRAARTFQAHATVDRARDILLAIALKDATAVFGPHRGDAFVHRAPVRAPLRKDNLGMSLTNNNERR